MAQTRASTTRRRAPSVPSRYFSLVEGAATVSSMVAVAPGGRITRERYWQLVGEGVIDPDERIELLEGVIVAMVPRNPPHAFTTTTLTRLLSAALGQGATLRVQSPFDIGEFSTPEPDFAVVPGRAEDYLAAHPTRALLVIEVSDTTLSQDRITKGAIYAAGGVPEYWIVNLRNACVEVHRAPRAAERRYAERHAVHAGDRLEPIALPGVSIAVAEILPPT